MTVVEPRAAAMLALLMAACATEPTLVSGKPRELRAHPLPAYQVHEECARLAPGDRLSYSFEAQAPLHFNIHYHEGKTVVMPLSRDKVTSDRGEFRPLVEQEYCLMWEAGVQGTLLDYRVQLVRGAKK